MRGVDRVSAHKQTDELLAAFDLSPRADDRVKTFSGGMKRRLDLARALVVSPQALLLDEPTAGLDPPGRSALTELLAGLASAQLIATHDLELADHLCSRVLLLEGGTLGRDEVGPTAIRNLWSAGRPPL
jgi:ABC-2 type transport system ATP-binding protein